MINLASGIQNAEHEHLEGFAAAGGDEDIALLIMNTKVFIVLLYCLDEYWHTGGSSIFENGKLKILNCIKVCRRGSDIGLTDIEMVNLLSLLFGGYCIGMELAHRRKIASHCFL